MENKYVTRQELANEFGLNVKALMKKLHKKNIFPDERERISPALQREIRKVVIGEEDNSKPSDHGGVK
jgi:hypothetical protein